jgi:starch synthase
MLIGTGEDAEEFGHLVEALPSCTIVWTNRYITDRSIIRDFLAAGDVFAFPSRLEGFPVAPIEAMACCLPVVAAAASGIHEIFNDDISGGLVVPAADVDGFTEALARMIDNPPLSSRLGQQARQRVEAAFSLEAVGRQLETILFCHKMNGAGHSGHGHVH